MNISKFNNVLYNGNINRDFYFYCLRKNKKLIKYLFIDAFLFVVSIIVAFKKDIFKIKRFKYLKDVKNVNKEINCFLKDNKKINTNVFKDIDIIVDEVPVIFIKSLFKKTLVCGYSLNKEYEVDIDDYNKKIDEINKCDVFYVNKRSCFSNIKAEKIVVVKISDKRFSLSNNSINIILCVLLSFILTCISFLYNDKVLNFDYIFSYFSPLLFLLNFLPIFLLMILLLFIFKRINISWIILFAFVLALGVANQTVLTYRDDVVKFGDLALLKEATIMTNRYDLVIKKYTILAFLLGIIVFFLLKRYVNKISVKKIKRLICIIIIFLISIILYYNVYQSEKIYDKVGNKSLINVWIFTRQSQIRGLVYPFIYSVKDCVVVKPNGYNAKHAKDVLSKYNYEDIPSNKKVNIISIMLEAYNDFSKFKEISFNKDIYKPFHEIQANSISGSLVTTIFGGGTVVTERNFLTGFYHIPNLRRKTNSYVWYFKNQGYRVEAMHPIYGAFYNRSSIDLNLGFDYYYNYENTFSKMQKEFLKDDDFFNFIEEKFVESKNKNIPYFNFSVTYQNHGPYSGETYDGKKYYFDNNGYNLEDYNVINEYFSGIESTNEALSHLVSYFDNEDSPVIIILFGDHNPYLGNGYSTLGLNMDISEVSGFENYYETPYIIHANDSAKKMFNKSFVGKGNTISPVFLMNELFEYIDLNANEYMQYMSDLKKKTDVVSEYYYKENGIFIPVNNSKIKDVINEYEFVNYYVANNFINGSMGG